MEKLKLEAPVFFCAGEPSGDVYAGLFIQQLRTQYPEALIRGVGDGNMHKSGADIILGYDRLMAFGLGDSLPSLISHYCFYREIVRCLLRVHPRTFIAVAYPGLNMLLCRIAKRHGMRVYYMLPPQIWAWGGFRRVLLRRWVDVVISFFPFEAEHYRRLGFETMLFNNPVVDSLRGYVRRDRRERIGFMPGSRRSQVARNLPVALELARHIRKLRPDIELCLLAYDGKQASDLCRAQDLLPVHHTNRYQTMKDCDLLFISSGTASLEAAAMRVPQIFFHRTSFLDEVILRKLVRVRELNIANLYYGEKTVPCFIMRDRHELIRKLKDAIEPRIPMDVSSVDRITKVTRSDQ
jgi:lipid-A-disaccharide synthase